MLRNCESIKISVINILSAYTAAAKKGKFLLVKYSNAWESFMTW